MRSWLGSTLGGYAWQPWAQNSFLKPRGNCTIHPLPWHRLRSCSPDAAGPAVGRGGLFPLRGESGVAFLLARSLSERARTEPGWQIGYEGGTEGDGESWEGRDAGFARASLGQKGLVGSQVAMGCVVGQACLSGLEDRSKARGVP